MEKWINRLIAEINDTVSAIILKLNTLSSTKEDISNKKTDLTSTSNTHYPSVPAVKTGLIGAVTESNTYTDTKISTLDSKFILKTEKGSINGVAELDNNGKIPSSQLPSYVDDVLEFDNKAAFPTTGESGKIYIAKDTELTYRWSGTMYVEISQSLALGETSTTAYAGDKGATNRTNLSTLSAAVSGPAGTYTYAARTSSNYLNSVNNAYAADTALDVAIANVSSGSSTADTASKTRDNAIATALKAGTSFSGNAYTYNPNTTANYISAASSFNDADVKLDAAIKSVATLIDNIGWNEAA